MHVHICSVTQTCCMHSIRCAPLQPERQQEPTHCSQLLQIMAPRHPNSACHNCQSGTWSQRTTRYCLLGTLAVLSTHVVVCNAHTVALDAQKSSARKLVGSSIFLPFWKVGRPR